MANVTSASSVPPIDRDASASDGPFPAAHEHDARAGPVNVHRQILADEHAPRGDRCERIRVAGVTRNVDTTPR